jgi:hypothetical protein
MNSTCKLVTLCILYTLYRYVSVDVWSLRAFCTKTKTITSWSRSVQQVFFFKSVGKENNYAAPAPMPLFFFICTISAKL